MVCTPLGSIESVADFLVYATSCNYYFWLYVLGAIFLVVAWAIFKAEEDRKGEGEIVSALGISSIAVTSIGVIGSLIEGTTGIPVIQSDILLYMVAATVVFVMIWIFKD